LKQELIVHLLGKVEVVDHVHNLVVGSHHGGADHVVTHALLVTALQGFLEVGQGIGLADYLEADIYLHGHSTVHDAHGANEARPDLQIVLGVVYPLLGVEVFPLKVRKDEFNRIKVPGSLAA